MARFRIIRRGEDPPPNEECICPCNCGRKTVNGAAMCSTCAAELCAHQDD